MRPENDVTNTEILEDLARHGIEAALCTHAHCAEYDPVHGNKLLTSLELLSAPVRVERCFTVMPGHTGEIPRGRGLAEYLATGRAAAVRVLPSAHGYSLSDLCARELLETVEAARLPLLVELADTSWAEIDGVLEAHPALRTIVLRVAYREDRRLYALLEKHANLFVETSVYVGHRAIERVVQAFGARRLIFGTGAPLFAPGGAVAPIVYAEISDEDKAAIAGGNLRELTRGREALV